MAYLWPVATKQHKEHQDNKAAVRDAFVFIYLLPRRHAPHAVVRKEHTRFLATPASQHPRRPEDLRDFDVYTTLSLEGRQCEVITFLSSLDGIVFWLF